MDDLISRQALCDWLKWYGNDAVKRGYKPSMMYIWKYIKDEFPSMQPKYIFGRWKESKGSTFTPSGTSEYVCAFCGKSAHLHGVEFPRRKLICDNCGRINIYPNEQSFEQIHNYHKDRKVKYDND